MESSNCFWRAGIWTINPDAWVHLVPQDQEICVPISVLVGDVEQVFSACERAAAEILGNSTVGELRLAATPAGALRFWSHIQ
jgi:hypothetical protein